MRVWGLCDVLSFYQFCSLDGVTWIVEGGEERSAYADACEEETCYCVLEVMCKLVIQQEGEESRPGGYM